MSCRQATFLCEKKCEEKISLGERLGMWLHMRMCSLCRMFKEQSDFISVEAAKLKEPFGGTFNVLDEERKAKWKEEFKTRFKN